MQNADYAYRNNSNATPTDADINTLQAPPLPGSSVDEIYNEVLDYSKLKENVVESFVSEFLEVL